jgi:hypothetical protein
MSPEAGPHPQLRRELGVTGAVFMVPLDARQRVRHRDMSAWCRGRLGHETFRTQWAQAAEAVPDTV